MPRRLALIVVPALAIPLAACEPEIRAFDLTAPEAPVELLPIAGEAVDVTWTVDADDAADVQVAVTAVPTTGTSPTEGLGVAALAQLGLRYVYPPDAVFVQPPPRQVAAGVYQVVALALDDDGDVLTRSTAPGLLVVQGVTFRDPELTFTADVDQRDIWMTTVTATTVRAVISLENIDGAPGGVISEGVIASDLSPVGRVVTFTGRTVEDVAIPAGDYRAVVAMTARDGTRFYQLPGPLIHWRP